jgi:hypothetical protein
MSSSSNLVNQLTTNSRWSLFPSIMSFHLHRASHRLLFFNRRVKKMGGWRRNRAQTLEDPLLQRAKIQEEKEKKTKQKSKTKRRIEK